MSTLTHLENRVGDTPLVRCPRLAEHIGLPKLRLKMEGTNPTGTQKDRIAHLEIKEALARKASEVTAASCGNFGVAVAHAAHIAEIPCTIFVPEEFHGERIDVMERLGATVRRVPGTYEDAIDASKAHAEQGNVHGANPGGPSTLRTLAGYGEIAEELIEQSNDPIEAVGLPIGNGTTLAGVHFGFRAAWAKGRIEYIPRVYGGTSAGNNPVPASFARKQRRCTPLEPRAVSETPVNEPLVNWDALDGTACMTAMQDSHGEAYGFEDDVLMDLHDALLEDGYDAHPASLSAVAALQEAVKAGLLDKDANAIAVLTSGRTTIIVDPITEPEPDLNGMVTTLRKWLGQFGDPEMEVEEALTRAFDGGMVLRAHDATGVLGYTILTPMPFKSFFPTYHLSYIAVDQRARGRGVGTLLMEEAIRVTDGDVSLHVETNNDRAIRLYEKFGFQAKYYRMLYKGPRPGDVDPAEGAGWHGTLEEQRLAAEKARKPDETLTVPNQGAR